MIARKKASKLEHALERFDQYVEQVKAKKVVACKWIRKAIKRHLRDLKKAKGRGYRFDRREAAKAICFVEAMKHSKGKWAGKNLILQPWQCFAVGCLFGWKRIENGLRRFRLAYWEVARKNGKSTLCAAIALKLFLGDGEHGAEVYSTATTREQAKIVHEEAKRMVRKHPALRDIVKITRDNMAWGDSKYEPIPADGTLLDGRSPSGAIVDELHAHKSRELFDVIDTGTGAREQALLVVITTAGRGGDPTSICREQHDYCEQVLNGTIEDDTFFGLIFALDEGDDWADEKVWEKANPNLRISVHLGDLKARVEKAKNTPAAALTIRQKNFNEWVGSFSSWIEPEKWQRCDGGVEWFDSDGELTPEAIERFRGRECWIGMDLSSVNDLTSVVAAFDAGDGFLDVVPWSWCPRPRAIGRTRDRRGPFLQFAEAGHLILTETSSVDYDAIRAHLCRMRDEWDLDIQEIAADPSNARYLLTKLIDTDGFDEDLIIEHRQTPWAMNDPVKTTEKLVLDCKLRHGGNKVLGWCVANAITRSDSNGNLKLDKERSREKIDTAVALVMACGRAVAGEAADESSVYEERGAIFL